MVDFEVGWTPQRSPTRQIFVAFIVSTGSLCLGSVLGWFAPALQNIEKSEEFGTLTQGQKTSIASSVLIGAAFGYPVAMFLLLRMGRRITLLSISVTLILAWIIIACSDSLITLNCGIAISGICAESIAATIPIYVHEISARDSPKFLKYLHFLFIYIGVLLSFIAGALVDWHWLSVLSAMIPMFFICFMVYMPETPQYFLAFKKYRSAQKSLTWLNGATDNFEINQDLSEIKLQLEEEGLPPVFRISVNDIFKPSFIKPLLISSFLAFLQVFSGIFVFIFYPYEIFKLFSIQNIVNNDIALIIISSLLVISVIVSLFISETLKSKTFLCISCVGVATFMGILGTCTHLDHGSQDETVISWIGLVSLCGFVGFYGIGLASDPLTIMQRITPIKYKGWIFGLVNSLKWIFAFLTIQFFYINNQFVELGVFWVISGVNFLGFIIVYFVIPNSS